CSSPSAMPAMKPRSMRTSSANSSTPDCRAMAPPVWIPSTSTTCCSSLKVQSTSATRFDAQPGCIQTLLSACIAAFQSRPGCSCDRREMLCWVYEDPGTGNNRYRRFFHPLDGAHEKGRADCQAAQVSG